MNPRPITVEIGETLSLSCGDQRVAMSHDQARTLLLWLFRSFVTGRGQRCVTIAPQSF